MAVYLLTQTVINCKPIDNMAKKNIKASEKEEKDTANKKTDTTEHKEHSPNNTRAASKSHPADEKKKQSTGEHKSDAGGPEKSASASINKKNNASSVFPTWFLDTAIASRARLNNLYTDLSTESVDKLWRTMLRIKKNLDFHVLCTN